MKNVKFPGRWNRSWAVGLLFAVGTLTGLPAAASDSVSQLHHRQQRVAARNDRLHNEIRHADEVQTGLLARVGALDADLAKAQSKVQSLDADITQLDSRINATRERLQAAAQQLTSVTAQLQSILRRLDARTKVLTARAVAAYMAGPTAGFDALLSSQSFGDLMDRYTYYQSALSTDTKMIEQIQRLRDATETHRSSVASQRNGILAAKTRLQADREKLDQQRSRKKAALDSLRTLLSQKRAAVTQIEGRKAQLEQAIAENARESASIESLLRAANGRSGPVTTGGGQLLWPAIGPITSPFGWRVHPIFHTREFHAGIDIGAPYGATVGAADAGVIEFAGTMSGYGNVLVVDHGGGLATLYGHLSSYSVSVGQSVSRGAPIARVGCTGWCTGPHLHFEVRLFGSPVDPMPYLN